MFAEALRHIYLDPIFSLLSRSQKLNVVFAEAMCRLCLEPVYSLSSCSQKLNVVFAQVLYLVGRNSVSFWPKFAVSVAEAKHSVFRSSVSSLSNPKYLLCPRSDIVFAVMKVSCCPKLKYKVLLRPDIVLVEDHTSSRQRLSSVLAQAPRSPI